MTPRVAPLRPFVPIGKIVPAVQQGKQDLERLEGIIQKNIGAFYEVGRALAEIRDKGYYCDVLGFETFEAYCKAKWDFTRSYAYRLIDSAKVMDALSPIGDIHPATESQCRPLIILEPSQQRQVWQQAVATAPDGKVTAAHVAKTVKAMTTEKPGEEGPKETGERRVEHRGSYADWQKLTALVQTVKDAVAEMQTLRVDVEHKVPARTLCELLAKQFSNLAQKLVR